MFPLNDPASSALIYVLVGGFVLILLIVLINLITGRIK